jgi:fluoroquinolone transport system permease protein
MTALGLFAPRRLWRLASSDALNIARDPILVMAAVMSLLPALLLAVFRDEIDAAALSAFDVTEFSRYIVPAALAIPAGLVGWVTGFLMLEDRDEGTLLALDVTPVGKSGFILYRVSITAALATAITLYAWPLILPGANILVVACLAALVALNAIGFAVVLPAVARNKVEGLAVTKITNLLALAPLLAAIPSPLRYVGGILPTYWIGELLGLTDVAQIPPWLAAILGLAVSLVAVVALLRLFDRKAG